MLNASARRMAEIALIIERKTRTHFLRPFSPIGQIAVLIHLVLLHPRCFPATEFDIKEKSPALRFSFCVGTTCCPLLFLWSGSPLEGAPDSAFPVCETRFTRSVFSGSDALLDHELQAA